VEAWARDQPRRRELLEDIRRIWAEAKPPTRSFEELDDDREIEAEWKRLKDKMESHLGAADGDDALPRPVSADRPPSSRPPTHRPAPPSEMPGIANLSATVAWTTAATVAILLGIAWLAGGGGFFSGSGSPAEPYREVVTERGERARVQFADGTTAMLNVDSRLQLPRRFDAGRRVVHLTGEAFFEVKTDSTRPFVLKTDDATVRVTGTSFNVRGYPDDEDVEVAVAEGGVVFRSHPATGADHTSALALTTGDVARLRRASAQVTKRESADLDAFTAWTRGRLLFDNTPLRQVAGRLERWYNLDVEIRDAEIASLRLTADLKSQSVRNVLDVISTTLNIAYRIDDGTVYLTATAPVQSRT
jgi:ferric-dicitrate binding protein FerR (iron transport regulator)